MKNRLKRSVIRDRFAEAASQLVEFFKRPGKSHNFAEELEEATQKFIRSMNVNNPIQDSDFKGPITTWIEHEDIDWSKVTLDNVKGGPVTVHFEETTWGTSWSEVSPNGQTAPVDGKLEAKRDIPSGAFDGDHRLKTSCEPNVTYHLRFESKDD